jgi:threonine dehydratase
VDLTAARARLARYFAPTPLVRADSLSADGRVIYLKNETVLPTGSFKVRGAMYALSTRVERGAVREVVAASTGNHGAAVAFAARMHGIQARIFLPSASNPVKVARIRDLGAALVEGGTDLSAATDAAEAYADREGAFFLHDAREPDIPIGTATIGAEILEQLEQVGGPDAVYIPMGDTALIRGVAAALRRAAHRIHVVGVAAERAPAYYLSWKSGTVVETATAATIADGLAITRPLAANVAEIRKLVDEVVLVSEREMLDAIGSLQAREGIQAEPAGAASVAAWLRDASRAGPSVAIVSGQNISPDIRI